GFAKDPGPGSQVQTRQHGGQKFERPDQPEGPGKIPKDPQPQVTVGFVAEVSRGQVVFHPQKEKEPGQGGPQRQKRSKGAEDEQPPPRLQGSSLETGLPPSRWVSMISPISDSRTPAYHTLSGMTHTVGPVAQESRQ